MLYFLCQNMLRRQTKNLIIFKSRVKLSLYHSFVYFLVYLISIHSENIFLLFHLWELYREANETCFFISTFHIIRTNGFDKLSCEVF